MPCLVMHRAQVHSVVLRNHKLRVSKRYSVIGRRRFPAGFDKSRSFYPSWLNYSQFVSTKYSRPKLSVSVCVLFMCLFVCLFVNQDGTNHNRCIIDLQSYIGIWAFPDKFLDKIRKIILKLLLISVLFFGCLSSLSCFNYGPSL